MNRVQKMSWSFVISIPLAMILGIVAFVVHHFGLDSPRPFVFSAVGVMGVAVFLTFFIFKKDKGKVTFDERDKLFDKNIHLAGFGTVYLLVILISYVPFFIAPEAKIPTKWFPGLLPIVGLCQGFAMCIATLVQYGRGGKENE